MRLVLCFLMVVIVTYDPMFVAAKDSIHIVTLNDCISTALTNNSRTLLAKEAQVVARAQHQQALSKYWPTISFSSTGTIRDEPLYNITESFDMSVPVSSLGFPSGTTVDATVPEQKNKLTGTKNLDMDLTASYILWAGGKRRAVTRQTKINNDIASQGVHREALQLIHDVKKTYYGLALAEQLKTVGHENLDRMRATLLITEAFYKEGMRVRKTDYLRSKFILEAAEGVVAELDSNVELARTALANLMGLKWNASISIVDKEIPFSPFKMNATTLVNSAYNFNVDMQYLESAIDIYIEKVSEARADYFPTITLFGNLRQTFNSYNKGLVNKHNTSALIGGLNITMPLFDGFRTEAAVTEAMARLRRLKHKKILMKQSLALRLKSLHLAANRTAKQVKTTKSAMLTAKESRELHEKAYTLQMTETRDVIEAQIAESRMAAKHFKALFDHYEVLATIELVLGGHLSNMLSSE